MCRFPAQLLETISSGPRVETKDGRCQIAEQVFVHVFCYCARLWVFQPPSLLQTLTDRNSNIIPAWLVITICLYKVIAIPVQYASSDISLAMTYGLWRSGDDPGEVSRWCNTKRYAFIRSLTCIADITDFPAPI